MSNPASFASRSRSFAVSHGTVYLICVVLFSVIEIASLLIWLATEGYFTASQKERLFRDAQWQVVEVRRASGSALGGEKFVPNGSVWTVPDFSNGNYLKAGIITKGPGWYYDDRSSHDFTIDGDILKMRPYEFRIAEIDRKHFILNRLENGTATDDFVRFQAEPLPEYLQTHWYFYLIHLIVHFFWLVPLVSAIVGFTIGKRVTESRRRAWWTTAISTTLLVAVIGTIIASIITVINNRHSEDYFVQLIAPPCFFVVFTILSLPLAVANGFLQVARMKREGQ
jgi:4-amino-4-deoxy-L-arabinose transferase-like glycosyltransferase